MDRFFHFLNKYFMVPLFRLGFGPFFGNPLIGYIMVLKVIGRKTVKVRYTPVNYAIADGNAYFPGSSYTRSRVGFPVNRISLAQAGITVYLLEA